MTASAGVVVWFTGLPASGKTTLARHVRDRISQRAAILLDSDELREALGESSYVVTARDDFYRRLAALAILLARQGHVVLVAATAPRRAYRDAARAGSSVFLEVWVRTSRADCEARDPKGLYARARSGEAPDLPGVGVAYEEPVNPAIVADGGEDLQALDQIVAAIEQHLGH